MSTLRSWLALARGHGLWILAWSIVGWVGTAAAPFLSDHPFLVMLLAPRALFVALATDSVGIVTFVALGTLRLGATDASYFVLGRRFARFGRRPRPRLVSSIGARVRAILVRVADRFCRWLAAHGIKAGTVLFLRPNGRYLAVAGAYGVSARLAGLASVIGTAAYLASFHVGLGLVF